MIRYTLKCDQDHRFESWFADSAAYDKLVGLNAVACPTCGSTAVEKTLMAPKVSTPAPSEPTVPSLSAPSHPLEKELKALREKIEKEADYVGSNFATEARAMHDGEQDHRPIWGEAKPEEAKALAEDGVAIAPLPFNPRKTN